jgi:glycosyltransferase involved in cell wall biosynthesis
MLNQDFSFLDPTRDLLVITTVTNWDEPPRIRHEVAHQMSRFYNVVFVQIFCQRGKRRHKYTVSDSMIVTCVGLCFPGMTRLLMKFPILMKVYNKYLTGALTRIVKKYSPRKAILMNFQFNAAEFCDRNIFDKCYFFCNEDFINQNLSASLREKTIAEKMQAQVIACSDAVFAVSEPLKDKLISYGAENVHVIHSAHNFDLEFSLRNINFREQSEISVCYMGFLNQYINIDWFRFILEQKDMRLTIVGPVAYESLLENIRSSSNFKHAPALTGFSLQKELLEHDVLVMPYASPVDNEVTSVPAKLYQYLAVGRPVVSSIMPNLKLFPDKIVYQSETKISFVNLIRKAAREDTVDLRRMRVQVATHETWNARGEQIYAILT